MKKYEEANAADIQIWIDVLDWMVKGGDESSLYFLYVLSRDNRDQLEQVLGKPSQYFHGEFYFHVWRIEFQGYTFWILTAKTKGTCYEVETIGNSWSDDKKPESQIIKDFLKDLYYKLTPNLQKYKELYTKFVLLGREKIDGDHPDAVALAAEMDTVWYSMDEREIGASNDWCAANIDRIEKEGGV